MEKVKELRPIDDVFFEVFANDTGVCEEMLRVILEDPNLIVTDVIVQNSEKNIYGRSVRLDALCILGSGNRVNIEVQRSDNDDHLNRARFNAASITVKDSNSGDKFKDVVDVYIIYINEFDFLKEKKTIYHIDKVIRETGTVIDNAINTPQLNRNISKSPESRNYSMFLLVFLFPPAGTNLTLL